jgi:hypothetical protein
LEKAGQNLELDDGEQKGGNHQQKDWVREDFSDSFPVGSPFQQKVAASLESFGKPPRSFTIIGKTRGRRMEGESLQSAMESFPVFQVIHQFFKIGPLFFFDLKFQDLQGPVQRVTFLKEAAQSPEKDTLIKK